MLLLLLLLLVLILLLLLLLGVSRIPVPVLVLVVAIPISIVPRLVVVGAASAVRRFHVEGGCPTRWNGCRLRRDSSHSSEVVKVSG